MADLGEQPDPVLPQASVLSIAWLEWTLPPPNSDGSRQRFPRPKCIRSPFSKFSMKRAKDVYDSHLICYDMKSSVYKIGSDSQWNGGWQPFGLLLAVCWELWDSAWFLGPSSLSNPRESWLELRYWSLEPSLPWALCHPYANLLRLRRLIKINAINDYGALWF